MRLDLCLPLMMLCPLEAWAQEEGGTEETSAEVVAENSAESGCERAASPADFYLASDMGEQAFVDLDLDGLMVAQADALWALRCANQQISDKMAAAFHRLMAFSAFTEGDDARVLVEFHAARRLEPGYLISAEVVPEGHPLRLHYEAATDKAMEVLALPSMQQRERRRTDDDFSGGLASEAAAVLFTKKLQTRARRPPKGTL